MRGFLFTNWKTSLTGLIVILLTTAGPVLEHYYPVLGMNWTMTLVTIAGLAAGTGLMAAKDGDTHSTVAQVEASQAMVEGKPTAPDMVKAAELQAEGKKP